MRRRVTVSARRMPEEDVAPSRCRSCPPRWRSTCSWRRSPTGRPATRRAGPRRRRARRAGRDPSGARRAAPARTACRSTTWSPTPTLLPPESIRFFYLDRNWTDALVDGVLSVGHVHRCRADPAGGASASRSATRSTRPSGSCAARRRGTPQPAAAADQRLPAALASWCPGWPGLHVRAYRVDRGQRRRDHPRVRPRPAQGAPAWSGSHRPCCSCCSTACPRSSTSRSRARASSSGRSDPRRPNRSPRPGRSRCATQPTGRPRPRPPSPCRSGVTARASSTCASCATASQPGRPPTSAATPAWRSTPTSSRCEMLRFPFRQVFGDPANEPGKPLIDVFVPRVAFAEIEARWRAVILP